MNVSSMVGDLLVAFVERLSAVDIDDEISAHRVRRLFRLASTRTMSKTMGTLEPIIDVQLDP